jgi:hypothetical protein
LVKPELTGNTETTPALKTGNPSAPEKEEDMFMVRWVLPSRNY